MNELVKSMFDDVESCPECGGDGWVLGEYAASRQAAIDALVEGVRALRRRGGTATEMFAALDHYDEVMGK